jgi:hypothetical protein
MCTIGFGLSQCRDDHKLYMTEKEKAILQPAHDLYVKMAQECV